MHLLQLSLLVLQAVAWIGASPVAGTEAREATEYVPRNRKQSKHLRYEKRAAPQFVQGQPDDGNGKGGPLLGKLTS